MHSRTSWSTIGAACPPPKRSATMKPLPTQHMQSQHDFNQTTHAIRPIQIHTSRHAIFPSATPVGHHWSPTSDNNRQDKTRQVKTKRLHSPCCKELLHKKIATTSRMDESEFSCDKQKTDARGVWSMTCRTLRPVPTHDSSEQLLQCPTTVRDTRRECNRSKRTL